MHVYVHYIDLPYDSSTSLDAGTADSFVVKVNLQSNCNAKHPTNHARWISKSAPIASSRHMYGICGDLCKLFLICSL